MKNKFLGIVVVAAAVAALVQGIKESISLLSLPHAMWEHALGFPLSVGEFVIANTISDVIIGAAVVTVFWCSFCRK